jgi:hypothetical protein
VATRLVLASTLALLAAFPAWAATAKPSLRVVHDLPLTVTGTSFRASERITVTVRMAHFRSVSHLRADQAGRFTLRLAGVRLNHCARPLSIVAIGTTSGTAEAAIPMTECAAP